MLYVSATYRKVVELPNSLTWDVLLAVEAVLLRHASAENYLWQAKFTTDEAEYAEPSLFEVKQAHNPSLSEHFLIDAGGFFSPPGADEATFAFIRWSYEHTVTLQGPDKVRVFGLYELVNREIEKPGSYGDPTPKQTANPSVAQQSAPPLREELDPGPIANLHWLPQFVRDTSSNVLAAIIVIVIVAVAGAIWAVLR